MLSIHASKHMAAMVYPVQCLHAQNHMFGEPCRFKLTMLLSGSSSVHACRLVVPGPLPGWYQQYAQPYVCMHRCYGTSSRRYPASLLHMGDNPKSAAEMYSQLSTCQVGAPLPDTSERGVCGGTLTFHFANLMSHSALRQSLACVSLPYHHFLLLRHLCLAIAAGML
jgi:hypothetical protein